MTLKMVSENARLAVAAVLLTASARDGLTVMLAVASAQAQDGWSASKLHHFGTGLHLSAFTCCAMLLYCTGSVFEWHVRIWLACSICFESISPCLHLFTVSMEVEPSIWSCCLITVPAMEWLTLKPYQTSQFGWQVH